MGWGVGEGSSRWPGQYSPVARGGHGNGKLMSSPQYVILRICRNESAISKGNEL